MKYTFKNKAGDTRVLTEEEVKQLLLDNGDMPDELVIPTLSDKDFYRIK